MNPSNRNHTRGRAHASHNAPPNRHVIDVPPDLMGIVGFGTTARAVLPLTPVTAPVVLSAPAGLQAEGNTNMTDALALALEMLSRLPKRVVRRLVLVGDGEPNVKTNLLAEAVANCRAAWISVDTIFCGSERAGEEVLRRISGATVGGSHFNAGSFAQLKDLIVTSAARLHRRQGATVVAIDCSISMNSLMPDGGTRIGAAIAACQAAALIRRTAFARVEAMQ